MTFTSSIVSAALKRRGARPAGSAQRLIPPTTHPLFDREIIRLIASTGRLLILFPIIDLAKFLYVFRGWFLLTALKTATTRSKLNKPVIVQFEMATES